MADEPLASPSSDPDDASKAETIRITLPPKQEQAAVKRETVRINLPGRVVPPTGVAPKKETTKLPQSSSTAAPAGFPKPPSAPSAPGLTKPSLPPPPPPKSLTGPSGAAGAPPAPKPPGSAIAPPRPPAPSSATRPAVPLKPASPAAGATPAPSPIAQKGAAPKKETARITLPPEGSTAKPPLPKTTVKMGQTQPLTRGSSPALTPGASTMAPAPVQQSSLRDEPEVSGGGSTALAAGALVVSLIALGVVAWIYSVLSAAS